MLFTFEQANAAKICYFLATPTVKITACIIERSFV